MLPPSPEDFHHLGRLLSDGSDKFKTLKVLRLVLVGMSPTTDIGRADVDVCIKTLPKLEEELRLQTVVAACFCELIRIFPGCYDYNKEHLKAMLLLYVKTIKYVGKTSSDYQFSIIFRMMQAGAEASIWKVVQEEAPELGHVIVGDVFAAARDDHPAYMKVMWTLLVTNIVRENRAVSFKTKDIVLYNLQSPMKIRKKMATAILVASQEQLKNCRLYFVYVISQWLHIDSPSRLTYLRVFLQVARHAPVILPKITEYFMILLEVETEHKQLVANILTLVMSSCGRDFFSGEFGLKYFMSFFMKMVSDGIAVKRFLFDYMDELLQMNIQDPVIRVLTDQAKCVIDPDSLSRTLDMILANPCLSHLVPTYFKYAKNHSTLEATVMVCEKLSRSRKPGESSTKRALALLKTLAKKSDCTLLADVCETLEVHKNDFVLPHRGLLLEYSAQVCKASNFNQVVSKVVGSMIMDVWMMDVMYKSLRILLAQEHDVLSLKYLLLCRACMEELRDSLPSVYEEFMEKFWSDSFQTTTIRPPYEALSVNPLGSLQLDLFPFKPAVQCFERRKARKDLVLLSPPQPRCFKRRIAIEKLMLVSPPEPLQTPPPESRFRECEADREAPGRMETRAGKRQRLRFQLDEQRRPTKDLRRLDKAGSVKLVPVNSKFFTVEVPRRPRSRLVSRPRILSLKLGIADTVKLLQRGARKRMTISYAES